MPSHKQQPSVTATATESSVDPGSIPDKTAETWDDKFTLSESRLKDLVHTSASDDPFTKPRKGYENKV